MTKRVIALFGGTFDPVHIGHIKVARAARDYIKAEKLVLIPAKQSPLKRSGPVACDNDRLEMLSLAVSDKRNFEISDYELRKDGPSYTVETVKHFQKLYGEDALLCWLIGADNIDDLPKWYKVEQLIDMCNVSVMYRSGFERPDFDKLSEKLGQKRIEKLAYNIIPTPLVDVSSTDIRRRLCRGESVAGMLEKGVYEYILSKGLYGASSKS